MPASQSPPLGRKLCSVTLPSLFTPKDDRYAHLVGKNVLIPLSGRQIPIIADECVERDFGTGALKITPAHNATDYDVGQRHNLPSYVVLDQGCAGFWRAISSPLSFMGCGA